MPPYGLPHRSIPPFYDSATMHPVFFTEKVRRPPFPMPTAAGCGTMNPVAYGYVFSERQASNGTKL